jgi:preprotein translocase subunit SecG
MPGEVKWAIALAVGIGVVALGWQVPVILYVLHVLLCFLLIVVVLMQSGKAADLAGAFGGSGSQTAFGPRGAATVLSRVTTWCFVMFLLTTVSLTLRQSKVGPTGSSVLERTSKPAEQQTPAQPGQQPPAQPPAGGTTTPPQTPPPAQQQPVPATQQPAKQPPAPPKN